MGLTKLVAAWPVLRQLQGRDPIGRGSAVTRRASLVAAAALGVSP